MMDLSKSRALVFAPEFNTDGENDATGAFQPESAHFTKLFSSTSKRHLFDNTQPLAARRTEVLRAFGVESSVSMEPYSTVAVFSHGWMDGIQLGFLRSVVDQLASAIMKATHDRSDVVVPLYCCSTGKDPGDKKLEAAGTGDGSFADKLRDALCVRGAVHCRVMGHSMVGHTTQNPTALFFEGMGTPTGGIGGFAPCGPSSAVWSTYKRQLVKDPTFRFRMPYMSPVEIHDELARVAAAAAPSV